MALLRSTFLCGMLLQAGWLSAQSISPAPSDPQLETADIERKINDLLGRMTLKEKIAQLTQYSATEAPPDKDSSQATSALTVNPPAPGGVDSVELAQKGELGSMLSTVGQRLTNHFQHAAVD